MKGVAPTALMAAGVVMLLGVLQGCAGDDAALPSTTQGAVGGPSQDTGKTLISFIIKEGNDRAISIECPGGEISHDYTLNRRYICPDGSVVEDQTRIAVIKGDVAFVPIGSLVGGLQPSGVQSSTTEVLDEEPVGLGPLRRGTRTMVYSLWNDKASLKWSEATPDLIELGGEVRELSGEPFVEEAQRVAFYDDGPRYETTIPVGRGGAVVQSTITFVPLRDFVEPLGYEVKQTEDTVGVIERW